MLHLQEVTRTAGGGCTVEGEGFGCLWGKNLGLRRALSWTAAPWSVYEGWALAYTCANVHACWRTASRSGNI